MDVTVNSQILARELRLLDKIVSAKATIPMLTNVLLKTDEGELHLASTDLEVALKTSCISWVQLPGSTTLPSKKFLSIIDQLPNADVRLTMQPGKEQINLESGNFRSKLQTLNAADFPPIPNVQGDPLVLSAPGFRQMIERVRYAVSDKGEKRELTGALLTMLDTSVALVGTDGKRLALATIDGVSSQQASTILPIKTLDMLTSLEGDGEVAISSSERHLFFKMGDRTLVSRTIDGKFPNYERVIPRDNDKKATVGRAALAAAVRRVGLLAEEENSAIRLSFDADQVLISSRSAQLGEGEENVPATYQGEPVTTVLHWKYLLDFLNASTNPAVEFMLKSVNHPVLATDGPNFLNVIMTIRDGLK